MGLEAEGSQQWGMDTTWDMYHRGKINPLKLYLMPATLHNSPPSSAAGPKAFISLKPLRVFSGWGETPRPCSMQHRGRAGWVECASWDTKRFAWGLHAGVKLLVWSCPAVCSGVACCSCILGAGVSKRCSYIGRAGYPAAVLQSCFLPFFFFLSHLLVFACFLGWLMNLWLLCAWAFCRAKSSRRLPEGIPWLLFQHQHRHTCCRAAFPLGSLRTLSCRERLLFLNLSLFFHFHFSVLFRPGSALPVRATVCEWWEQHAASSHPHWRHLRGI